MPERSVFLCQPRGATVLPAARDAFWFASNDPNLKIQADDPTKTTTQQSHNEALCKFNNIKAKHGFTHFAMIHSDVVPVAGWLDVMLQRMDECGADVLSAVIPIKDHRGLTSTGYVLPGGDEWSPRRLTVRECLALKSPTFTHPTLAWNTGLWVAKDAAWLEKVAFNIYHRIIRCKKTGLYAQEMYSEDWDMARQARNLGVKAWATVMQPLVHEKNQWHTNSPWGTWEVDEHCPEAVGKERYMDWEVVVGSEPTGREEVAALRKRVEDLRSARIDAHIDAGLKTLESKA